MVRASSTCHHWRRVYLDSSLWRCRTFEFRGYCKSHTERIKAIKKYVTSLGQFMQQIRIICPSPNLLTAHNVATSVHAVLRGLSGLDSGHSNIKSFEICQLHFDETWHEFKNSKYVLVDTICGFLECQKNLHKVSMHHTFITSPFAFRIMKSLTKSRSTKTIEVLDVLHFYSIDVHLRMIINQMKLVFSQCQKLTEVKLNYSYLSGVGVETVCDTLKDTLRSIVLHMTVWDYSRHWSIIKPEQWVQACQSCPRLRVTFHMQSWPLDAVAYLTPPMPLVEVSVKGEPCRYAIKTVSEKIDMLLDHFSRLFWHSLELATFQTEHLRDTAPDKNLVLQFLHRCTNVRQLSFSSQIMSATQLQDVKDLARAQNVSIDQDVLRIV